MLATRSTCRASARTATTRRAQLVVRCSGNGATSGAFKEGQRVKVVVPLKVYHAPLHHDGLDLNGMEGTVTNPDATQYKGKVLSANLPVIVEFIMPNEGKQGKFKVHLSEEEIAAA
ncbi:hypothetical protein HYH03_011236 [Edaphochlamys debaryana]|uniref:Ferredoxin thioredoxin reductase alpha chain domain-containing protein n=1 Tax=Edaphochlamys debaryana TaxID=47281 RepID=A0A836BWM9_9CHLO|nr:hypothetical protein HYH03_011236 [Edaphochlamys debaryana]|eukprot:KAG2490284.1 hypothetical protein HYH03_011236 [Edaphochlamys debaryana]